MSETTWDQVGRTLEGISVRCHELGSAPDPRWQGLPVAELGLAMRVAEAKARPVCDEMMRSLARPGGVIGQMTPLQGYFCSLRCLCALDTLGILHAELRGKALYPVPPPWSPDALIEWLLVSNWEHRHDIWIKLAAYSGATGNIFYSG